MFASYFNDALCGYFGKESAVVCCCIYNGEIPKLFYVDSKLLTPGRPPGVRNRTETFDQHAKLLQNRGNRLSSVISLFTARSLRNAEVDLRLPLLKSAGGQKCFSYRGAKLWNSLGTDAKNSSTLRAFKREVEK